jgi:hypothetical protein
MSARVDFRSERPLPDARQDFVSRARDRASRAFALVTAAWDRVTRA